MKQLALFSVLILFGACQSNYGDVVVLEKVQVFYLSPITKKDAQKLANYCEEKKLIGEQTQFLQLSKSGQVIELKIIASDTTLLEEISFEIQLELFKLDSLLRKDVFPNQELQILISDKQFTKTKAL